MTERKSGRERVAAGLRALANRLDPAEPLTRHEVAARRKFDLEQELERAKRRSVGQPPGRGERAVQPPRGEKR